MQINKKAPVQASSQIHIHATPEKVWAVLTQIHLWTNWHPKISKAVAEAPAAVGTKFAWTINGAKIKSQIHTVDPFQSFGWSGTTFGGSAIHNWYLSSVNGGTLVQGEESMEGWLVALFKQKMNKDLAKDMDFWLEQLQREAER
jgi:uncharacterized protein YndB with AHSA1/START domain